jgi:hypothetical protein
MAKNPDQRKRFERQFHRHPPRQGELRAISYHLAYNPTPSRSASCWKRRRADRRCRVEKISATCAACISHGQLLRIRHGVVDLDGDLEVVIGLEVFEDNLFNTRPPMKRFSAWWTKRRVKDWRPPPAICGRWRRISPLRRNTNPAAVWPLHQSGQECVRRRHQSRSADSPLQSAQ